MKEMKKETVLICDNKSIFLKMFKKILTEKFEFSESSLQFDEKNTAAKDYDHTVYVIHDKNELLIFFKEVNIKREILLCVFDKELYEKLFFLDGFNGLFLLDAS